MNKSEIIDLIAKVFDKNYEIAKKVVDPDFKDYLAPEKITIWVQTAKEFANSLKNMKGFSEKSQGYALPEFKGDKLVKIELFFNSSIINDGEEFSLNLLHELIHICQYSVKGLKKFKSDPNVEDVAYANEIHYYYPKKEINHDYRKKEEKRFTIKFSKEA
jgi:hypothetical protein